MGGGPSQYPSNQSVAKRNGAQYIHGWPSMRDMGLLSLVGVYEMVRVLPLVVVNQRVGVLEAVGAPQVPC